MTDSIRSQSTTSQGGTSNGHVSQAEIREKFGELKTGVDDVLETSENKARRYAMVGGIALVILALLLLRRRTARPRALVEVYRV